MTDTFTALAYFNKTALETKNSYYLQCYIKLLFHLLSHIGILSHSRISHVPWALYGVSSRYQGHSGCIPKISLVPSICPYHKYFLHTVLLHVIISIRSGSHTLRTFVQGRMDSIPTYIKKYEVVVRLLKIVLEFLQQ